ncbi:MAG TPA: condensation domain-containing protein, partial [Actinophytocola sp.]|nr:condensation domain-containing protein [Actinophytocola sp.]
MGLLIPRRDAPGEPAPLSFAQDGIWIADQLDPGEPTYTTPMAVRLRGPLVRAALVGAVADVGVRHEVFRTAIRAPAGRPRQVVAADPPPDAAVTDLTGLLAEERYPAALARATEQARQYIDPAGPMGRFHLY